MDKLPNNIPMMPNLNDFFPSQQPQQTQAVMVQQTHEGASHPISPPPLTFSRQPRTNIIRPQAIRPYAFYNPSVPMRSPFGLNDAARVLANMKTNTTK